MLAHALRVAGITDEDDDKAGAKAGLCVGVLVLGFSLCLSLVFETSLHETSLK